MTDGRSVKAVMPNRADAATQVEPAELLESAPPLSPAQVVQMLHELRVHQIEMEMQNDELKRSQERLEKSREQLEQSQASYRDLYDLAPVGFLTLNTQGRVVQANICSTQLLNVASAELLGQLMDNFVQREDRDIFYLLKRQLVPFGPAQVRELRMIRADDSPFWAQLAAMSATNAHGAPEVRLVLTDISARRQAERDLEITAAKNRALISAIPDLIFTNHRNGTYLAVEASNPGMLFALPEAFLQRTVLEVLPPPIADLFMSAFAKAIESGQMQALKYSLLIGAQAMFFEARVAPVTDDTLVTIIRDMTAQKLAEDELRIAAIAFECQEGMFVTNAEMVILRVNRAFTTITGFSAEDAVGRKPDLLSSGRQSADFFEAMRQDIRASGSWQGEILNRRKTGEIFMEWLSITAVKTAGDTVTHYVAALTDVTDRKQAEEKIAQLAYYDPLTGLPNRRLLMDRLDKALAASARQGREGALFFVDLDKFKSVNDNLGHDMGDLLLQQVAQRLQACIREVDTVARLGGDEFVVMLVDLSESPMDAARQARAMGEKMLSSLGQPYLLGDQDYLSTSSIGVTLFARSHGTVEELLKRADLAMFQAKSDGRHTLRFFDPVMQASVDARATLEKDLQRALQQHQLRLYYQPQMTGERTLTGAEALVRWEHPQRGLVTPIHFITLAEETGLILPLGLWVLDTACQQLAAWATRPETAHLTLAVNVSARQFNQPDFVQEVMDVLARTGAEPQRLKLELTESLLVANVEDVIRKMMALKAHGVCFSLDDFGTGYSSLSYLKRLPLDQLKIDQGFVAQIEHDPNDAAIAKMVVALAASMGLSVIAEGVETQAQRVFLTRLGCDACQGYLFAPPLPLEAFEAFLKALPTLTM
jgi:diguanylate cyclase (GGDEF)-like protein/PAS domain S-box-containing protein